MSNLEDSPDHVVAFFLRLNIGRERAINSFEVHGLVDVRRQAHGPEPWSAKDLAYMYAPMEAAAHAV